MTQMIRKHPTTLMKLELPRSWMNRQTGLIPLNLALPQMSLMIQMIPKGQIMLALVMIPKNPMSQIAPLAGDIYRIGVGLLS